MDCLRQDDSESIKIWIEIGICMPGNSPRHAIRKDMLLVGTVILVVALLIYSAPVQNTFYADYNSFSPSPRPGVYDLGLLYIPSQDTLSAKLFSSSAILFGIVSQNAWSDYLGGNTSILRFLADVNGTQGSFSFTASTNTELYFVTQVADGGQLPVFKVIVVTTVQHSLADYAILASLPGLALVALSVTFERSKSHWFAFVRKHK